MDIYLSPEEWTEEGEDTEWHFGAINMEMKNTLSMCKHLTFLFNPQTNMLCLNYVNLN